MVRIFLLITFVVTVLPARSAEVDSIAEIGPHYPVVTFEKNLNPQNIMMIYTKLDKDCHFVTKNNLPVVDYYWLMDGARYKPVHPLIKRGIRKRLQVEVPEGPPLTPGQTFAIQFTDLTELDRDLEKSRIMVFAKKDQDGCNVEAFYNGKEKIELQGIYSEAKKTFLPPFRKVVSVTLKGLSIPNGEKRQFTYTAKK